MEIKKCTACLKEFESKLGEIMCEVCTKEMDEMLDKSELNRIAARRSYQFIIDHVERLVECHNCGAKLPRPQMSLRPVYEGTDFKEDSPINYPKMFFCPNCR